MTDELLRQIVTIDAIPVFRMSNRFVMMRVFWARNGYVIAGVDHLLNVNGTDYTFTDAEAKTARYSKVITWDTRLPLRLSITIGTFFLSTEINKSSMNLEEPIEENPSCIKAQFTNYTDSIKFSIFSNEHRVNRDTRRVMLYKAEYPNTPELYRVSHGEVLDHVVSTTYTDYATVTYEGKTLVTASGEASGEFPDLYTNRVGMIFKVSDESGNKVMWPNQPVVDEPSPYSNWAKTAHIQDTSAPYGVDFYIPLSDMEVGDNLSVQIAIIDNKNNFTSFSAPVSLGETLTTLLPANCQYMPLVTSYTDTAIVAGKKYNYKYVIDYIDQDFNQELTESVVKASPVFNYISTNITQAELIDPANDDQLGEYDFKSGIARHHMGVLTSNDPADYERYKRFIIDYTEVDNDDVCRARL